MSILHVLTITGVSLGWLPRSVSASAIGGIQSRLVARQFVAGSTGLILTPLEKALFGFCILFSFLTLVQLGCAFVMLIITRRPENDYRGRVPFLGLIYFSLLWLLISFVLSAIINSQDEVFTILLPIGVFEASNFAEILSPVFWYAGLVFLLFQRDAVSAFSGAPSGAKTTGVVTRIVASVLLFVMLVAAIISEVIFSYTVYTSDLLINVGNGLYYVYLAAYEVLTILIIVVSALSWKRRDPQSSSPTLNLFDSNVIYAILMIICPLMVIRALFELAGEIAVAHPSYASRINIYGINLATVLIEGTTQFVIFTAALCLGFPLSLTRRQY